MISVFLLCTPGHSILAGLPAEVIAVASSALDKPHLTKPWARANSVLASTFTLCLLGSPRAVLGAAAGATFLENLQGRGKILKKGDGHGAPVCC